MRQLKLFRWAAALMVAIALAPGAASAQEDGTITISSTFYMDSLHGNVGPDLAEVFANGHDHAWTLTLYGTSQSHETFTNPFGVTVYATEIHATSFDLEFFGPDAAMLNGIVSEHIAGGDVLIFLENAYSSGIGDDFAIMYVEPTGPDVQFFSEIDTFGSATLFPSDADGYPVVGPDPFSIWAEYSALSDMRPGNNGYIQSRASLVTFEGSVGPLPGDFNGDGIVNGADLTNWKTGFGTTESATHAQGDSDGDQDVDGADFLRWQTQLGASAAISTAIPEPGRLAIGVVTAIASTAFIRRRR
jgi:hypothetical protein